MPQLPDELKQDRLVASLPRDNKGRPVLGDVSLLRRLGVGGMGSVYLGRQGSLRREVAVKVLPFTLLEADPGLARRFAAEARMAASLESEHVVRVYGAGVQHRTHFFVMQYVAGESAGQLLKRTLAGEEQGVRQDIALRVIIGATKGLAAAHAKGIIHRDVKPDNILIPEGDYDGAKLADLGLAKPEGSVQTFGTMSNVAMGTPGFMAPEQAESAKSAGPAADVFAMGASFYALLMGGPPFRGSSLVAVIRAAMEEDHPPLPEEIAGGIRWVIDRCLCKNPKDRFGDGAELLAALQRVQKNPNATMAKQRSVAELLPAKKERNLKPLWWTAGVLVAGALVAGGLYIRHKRALETPPEVAPDLGAEKLDELFAQAGRQEKSGSLGDALATLTRISAFAPDDSRLREMRSRIEGKIEASKSAQEKSAAYRTYFPVADSVRFSAEAADTLELWDKLLEACAKLGPLAQTDAEKETVAKLKVEATQRKLWVEARAAEKGGNIALALDIARKAVAAGPQNEFLETYVASLAAKSTESEGKLRRKKEYDDAVAAAEKEADPAKARALWATAVRFADDPADISRAQSRLREVTARLQGAERDALFDVAMKEANDALKASDLELAAKRAQDALELKPEDASALDLQKSVNERRTAKDWDVAMKEIEAAKKAGDVAALKQAYRKALSLRDDKDIARALATLEREESLIKPKVTGDRLEIVLDAAKGVKLEFVKVKPGTWTLGASSETRKVTFTKEFWMQTTELTQDQWSQLMPVNNSRYKGGNLPVDNMTWADAMDYAEKLDQRLSGWSACLPSAAQWECACRAGTRSDWGAAEAEDGLVNVAWIPKNSGDKSHPVATLKPNAWGLFDMQGNLWEWCWDWLGNVPTETELTDPTGPANGAQKQIRGGCFNDGASATPGMRGKADPKKPVSTVGFRLVLMPGSEGNPHLRRMSIALDEAKQLKMDFVYIRSGVFSEGLPGDAEAPLRNVTVREDYWIATTEITQAQWEAVVGRKAFTRKGADLPADSMSWNEIQDFTRRLAAKTGKLKPSLPTEAEWEYAAHAGSSGHFPWGDLADRAAEFAWLGGKAKEVQPVAKLRPNAWGLFDMAGNVREWCSDWYAPYAGDATDPRGPDKGTERVLRGGGWDDALDTGACGARTRLAPDKRTPNAGFRIILR